MLSVTDLQSIGTTPHILSIENATVPEITVFLTDTKPDVILFSAGAGGKPGDQGEAAKERTMKVDYEGAVKVGTN